MNTDEPTQSLAESNDGAPSTSPLLKELLADVRELKSTMALLMQISQRIDQRLDSIEHEQRVSRLSVERLTGTQSHYDARLSVLEQDVLTLRNRAM
jgi:hypothetical protein